MSDVSAAGGGNVSCIVVHGGAGPFEPGDDAAAARAGCLRAAQAGWAILHRGGASLDAVEAAVRILEDDPHFNAGFGATLNSEGEVELDASIMEGYERRAGAVAGVRGLPNPITLARAVMERSGHVLLVSNGAERFAREQGFAFVPPESLIAPRAKVAWEARRAKLHGTVGAVACDAQGRLAAATSTGGTSNKRPGRVGDSPLIGCGTYADDRWGAVSCTGLGEAIIRTTLARYAVDQLAAGHAVADAAQRAIAELSSVGGEGGVILVTPAGLPAAAFSAQRMPRAWVNADGTATSGFEPF